MKQDKGLGSPVAPPAGHFAPQCGSLRGFFGVSKVGSKTAGGDHVCGHDPETLTATTKKQGSNPGKERFMGGKEKFPLYLSPEKKAILERRYQENGSRSMTAFIERAVDFYLDYLSANNSGLSCQRLSSPTWTGGWDNWRSGCPPWHSGRQWSRTWWLVSWPTPINSATRISAAGDRRACKM